MNPIERDLAARREDLDRSPTLRRLAARLERLCGGLLDGPVYLPAAKALLSRDGGVCPRDGARLAFHPYEPERHRCERCGGVFEGERHHRAWASRYHLWLSERAIHLALLGALLARDDLTRRAADIVEAIAARYRDYPNADNVLGPTRPFFSTYLESIWLAQLSVAALLLETGHGDALSGGARRTLRETVIESAGLIGSFDEGWSNRQVWHATALAAAGIWLGDDALVRGAAGRLAELLDAVGDDGLWHEGENYHLFALRGFLLGAEVLRWSGRDLYAETRLDRMYAAPLDTLLPDLTLPARGDAAFGVSVRQPRFAELWEIGRVRAADPRLDAILTRLYAPDAPEAEDGGLVELAEQEWNRPPHRQHRDRLGWKALCWMPLEHPGPGAAWERSALLEARGVAVMRDGGDRAAMLECGRRHGGHAHPDRLHLSVHWGIPLLADFGTGSYVNPSLHWYRSALAHNAPARPGVGQGSGPAACDGFGSEGGWQWCRARADGILGPGTAVVRSVYLGPDLVLDVVHVEAPAGVVVDLPVHPLTGVDFPVDRPGSTAGPAGPSDAGHETGYDRVEIAAGADQAPPLPLGESGVSLILAPRAGEMLLVARAPGPPGSDFADGPPLPFLI
ncbi:MAG TPA: heparinase II/III family protein, partial [Gemmatimonadales bacterium]|nr:heparinase II/III family protein [Gemmatimonadales bacterium]